MLILQPNGKRDSFATLNHCGKRGSPASVKMFIRYAAMASEQSKKPKVKLHNILKMTNRSGKTLTVFPKGLKTV